MKLFVPRITIYGTKAIYCLFKPRMHYSATCMFQFHVKTTQPILMKFGTEIDGTLQKVIGYIEGGGGETNHEQQLVH